MAISDTEKLDLLWKRFFGTAKTAGSADKAASNETIPSAAPVYPSAVWRDAELIPQTPPTADASDSVVALRTGAQRIRMTSDPTSPANVAWLAAQSYGVPAVLLGDFIQPSFGTGYAVKVWVGDPAAGPAARVFPDTTGEEWVFDYAAGVLIFTGTIPANKTATVGSGTVSVATHGVYIETYRYVGRKGVGGGTEGLGSMALQNADSVDISGGEIANVTLTNVTVDGGAF